MAATGAMLRAPVCNIMQDRHIVTDSARVSSGQQASCASTCSSAAGWWKIRNRRPGSASFFESAHRLRSSELQDTGHRRSLRWARKQRESGGGRGSSSRCSSEREGSPSHDSQPSDSLLETEAAGITTSGNFSISDENFRGEGLRFNTEGDSVDLAQLNGLFAKVGFPHRKRSKLQIALRHTLAMVWLLDTEQERLIAFARATGDAVFNATIWDVVVDPGWQKKGLGKAVIERLMADLLNKGITNVNLYAEPNVVSFYKPLGFVTDPSGISGMAFNKKKASL